jgi:CDP-diacylglycerol pyrophosphatase
MSLLRHCLLLALFLTASCIAPAGANPNALWQIVHDQCMADQETNGSPAPCTSVDLVGGTVVLKDRNGATQYLLIPTARRTGIEDPAILDPHAHNYFAAAWAARGLLDQRAGRPLPRTDVGLAINSKYGRSQDQLHIHIDCLRPDVIAALREHGPSLTTKWSPFPVPLAGAPYLARLVNSPDLANANPFTLLANEVPGASTAMGYWTLVVVGFETAGVPDFILLAGKANEATGVRANGESLLDHDCAVKSDG